MAQAVETRYAGCRFRSRLEARWAVAFDRLEVPWQYEPEGFVIVGRPYLPDFRLPFTGTWVEVKGDEAALDHDLMFQAAEHLPCDGAPRLLILGPIPAAAEGGEWAWMGLDAIHIPGGGEVAVTDDWWAIQPGGALTPARETSSAPPASAGNGTWLRPALNMTPDPDPAVAAAYAAARSARFEHGEKG